MREVLLSIGRRADHRALRLLAGAFLLLHPVPAAAQSFDHSAFDGLLRAHVTADGLVNYDASDRAPEFRAYKAALAGADLAPLPPAERLALWINAYDAYTIDLINRHDERRSIRNINRTLGSPQGEGASPGSACAITSSLRRECCRARFFTCTPAVSPGMSPLWPAEPRRSPVQYIIRCSRWDSPPPQP